MHPPSSHSAAPAAHCLLVDDDPAIRASLADAIESQGLAVRAVAGAREALATLDAEGEFPICVCAIALRDMDGVALLRELTSRHPDMAVVMLTEPSEVATAIECLRIGAHDYIAKPLVLDEVSARVLKALDKRHLVLQNRQALINGVEMLVFALEAKDAYTSGHSMRVKEFAVKTGVQLGYTGERLAHLELGSKLHDIGKIGTREAILNKPGKLAPDEFEHIKLHTVLGERILQPFLGESPMVLSIVRSHHERLDGTGFPDGLSGDAIPLDARIVAVADAYDAMTTNRAYRPSRHSGVAIQELRDGAGTHFDPQVVDAFLRAHSDITVLPVHA